MADWIEDTQRLLDESDLTAREIVRLTGLSEDFLKRLKRNSVEPGAIKLNKLHNFLAACQKPVSRKVRA